MIMPVALVTGSGRGIGRAIAIELAKKGYDIVLASRSEKELKERENEVKKFGVKTLLVKTDLKEKEQIINLVKETIKKFKRIDLLINNAGVAYFGEFSQNKEKEIREQIEVNLLGVIFCTKEVLPYMLKQKSGVIINISSGVGKQGHPELAVYSATKFGVIGFTESLALEIESQGVKVFAICPIGTNTKMYWDMFHRKATHDPEDVALEVMELLKNVDKIPVGSAIDVKKHT